MKVSSFSLLLALYLLFLSCDNTIYIDFESDPAVDPSIISDILSTPLPEGFAFSDPSENSEKIKVTIAVESWQKPNTVPAGTAEVYARRLLRQRWFVPAVPYSSNIFGYEKPHTDTDLQIVPLDELTLPNRGLPVSGMYPGDPDYPFFEDTVVLLTGTRVERGDQEAFSAVSGWIESFPGTPDDTTIIWIAAVGDLMPGRGVSRLLDQPDGLETVFTDTLAVLQRADIVMGNLEGAVTNRGNRKEKSYTFRFKPELLDALKDAGFDYLSLTNNHSYDYGMTGFLDTISHLRSAGILTSGAGIDPPAASAPATFNTVGGKIHVLSIGAYPPEKNGFDGETEASVREDRPGVLWANENGLKAVDAACTETGFDVLMVHGGVEWSTAPTPSQRELYRGFIDTGADVVIGSHPHVLHGIEVYKHGLIAYSLGNFIFPGMDETAYGEESLILLLGINGQKVKFVDLVPVAIDGKTLSIDNSGQILSRILERTRLLN